MKKLNNDHSSLGNYNYASGIKYSFKRKSNLKRKEFHSKTCLNNDNFKDEFNDKSELNRKHKNESEFQSISKKNQLQNKYERFKKTYDFEKEELEKIEEKENESENSNSKKINDSPLSILQKSNYTNKSIINSSIFGGEEDNQIKSKDKEERKMEIKEEKDNLIKNEKDNNIELNPELYNKKSKIKDAKRKRNKSNKNKKIKWNEEEYLKIKSEIINYNSLNEYDMNKYLLSSSQIENLKKFPQLYEKYNLFLSLVKEQDKFQNQILIKNILENFKIVYKQKNYSKEITIKGLFKKNNSIKIEYISTKKSAYFDMFIFFISMFIEGFEQIIDSNSNINKIELNIPFNSLAYLYSSKLFISTISKLIKNYYDILLHSRFEIIPIKIKINEYYRYKINMRKIIWKQFESNYLYHKNDLKLLTKDNKGEGAINQKQIKKFTKNIKNNVNSAFNETIDNIKLKHYKLNQFEENDNKISIYKKNSCSSSLYNQINDDIIFKLKLNIYKYNMRKLKVKKSILILEESFQKNEFKNKVKNKIFKQSVFYSNCIDVVEDFLNI